MKVNALKNGLLKLIPLLQSFGAKKLIPELEKLIRLMEAHENLSVDVFIRQARAGLEGGTAGKAGRRNTQADDNRGHTTGPRKAPAGGEVKSGLIAAYITKLENSSSADEEFQNAMEELSGDKRVRVIELKEIAAGFMGFQATGQKRADLLDEIKRKRAQDLRTRYKLKLLSEL